MILAKNVPCVIEMPAHNARMLVLVLLISTLISLCFGCVPSCQCTMAGSVKRQKGRKVDCAQHPAPFKSLASINFPPDTVHLDLSHNSLVILKQGSFIQLSSLQKLNLSSNQITILEPGTFDGLQSLKKLDLSNNQIGNINSNMFTGLPNLEKLFLSENRISLIPDGTFNDLRSLKRIEFKSDYLRCDCHLKWILKWTKTRHVRISSSTVCALPAKMKRQPLSQLKRKDLHCDHKLQLPIFDIRPSESQLVFQGDKLPFECHASITPGKMDIAWFRSGQLVTTNKSLGVIVHTSHNHDHTIINHRLVVESLDQSHAGEWSCVVSTATGNLTKTVHVEVRMPEIVLECPSVTNRTAKGVFIWEESMAGIVASQPCQKGEKGAMATHKCGMDGRWKSLNISACNFIRDITKKLSRFAKDNSDMDIHTLTSDMSKALVTATHNGEAMDSFDVYYLSKIMSTLLPKASKNAEVSTLIVNLVSNVSALPSQVIDMSQMETRSPLRMVEMLEEMSNQINTEHLNLEWTRSSENVAVVVLSRQQALQTGVSCALQGNREALEHGLSELTFYCSNDISDVYSPVHVQIPAYLAEKAKDQSVDSEVTTLPTDDENELNLNSTFKDKPYNISNDNNTFAANDSLFLDSTLWKPQSSPISSLPPVSDPRPAPLGILGSSVAFPSFPLSPNQLEALNISSQYFSKFPKPFNISSRNIFNISAKNLFPFAHSSFLPASQANVHKSISWPEGNVYVILYRTGQLFSVVHSKLSDPIFQQGSWVVVTPVIAVSIGKPAKNLTEPIVITFEVADARKPLKAAYFDFSYIDGYGGWRTDGCEVVQKNGSIITVHVKHLSSFALLQDQSFAIRQASFSMEPVIYFGSGVCILCMIIVFVTFISCFGSIGIPKKIKHAIVNVCLSTFLLLVTFVFGINRTDMEWPCKITGICIHYLTLSAVFWITITTNIIYKKFTKANRPPEPPPELVPMPLPPKPILQFYFVGYGVPVIICGITAAVNLKFYTGLQYCFLEWEPSLGAFYAPIALLVAWNFVLFMRISCVVRSVPETDSDAANDSDNEIHTNEIELIPSQPDTTTTTHNISSNIVNNNNNNGSSGSGYRRRYSHASNDEDEEDALSVVSIPDQERRPITQLRSLVVILFLFIVMWMCGALAIAKPFYFIIPYQDVIFSYVYGLMSSLFGLFMILYFCVTRKDSLLSWKRAGGCAPPENYTLPLDNAESQSEPPPSPQPQANGRVVKSNSNSNLSIYSQKSSNITKAYNMKNNSKQSNVNLIIPNSSEISFGSTQDGFPNFYNPRQNGAAKKFWQKNRHHSKVMNKDVNRDLNSSLTDNNSVVELNHHRLSHGTSSDANTHLSIEIQIQSKDKQGSFSGSREIPVHINNYQESNAQNMLGSSCGAISIEHNSQVSGLHSVSPDTGQANSPAYLQTTGSNSHLPQHQRSPSAGSLGTGVHPSAFTPVQPRNNNTLPRLGKLTGEEGDLAQQTDKEGSAPKNQLSGSSQIDGQNHSIEAGQRPPNPGVAWNPLHCNLPPLPSHPTAYSFNPPPPAHSQHQHYPFDFGAFPPPLSLNPHIFCLQGPNSMPAAPFTHQHPHPTPFNIPPSPYLIQSQTRGHVKSMSPGSSSSQSQSHSNRKRRSSGNSWRPLSGGDSSDSSRPRQKRTGSSPGRTVTYAPHSPVMSDSQAYEPRYQMANQNGQAGVNKARSVDSEHHSDPTHRKKHHRPDRLSKNKLTNKQRSLGWDEQFKDRPSKVNYVYVNHMYRDKVMHKLIKQASESDDLAKKAFWLPRSASEYERLTQKGFCNMVEDLSSSSDDDDDSLDDNVWIQQSSGSDFHKKETSV